MIEAGIVDPTKVTRSALQNAASIASMVLTTESIVADKPAKEALLCRNASDGRRHARYDVICRPDVKTV